jgi:uncharacterized damage-inducible protein DinB
MAGPKTLLEETIQTWRDVRDGVIGEAKNIPAAKWGWRPTPESRSVEELVVHILESGLLMSGELVRPDASFLREPYPKMIATYGRPAHRAKGRTELMKLLTSTLEDGIAAFEAAGERAMFQDIVYFNGDRGSRFAWMQHGIQHEYYHCGQLALYARLMGITPALTKIIQGSA